MTLQPVLVPVKGTSDLTLSVNPKYPDELFVFLGMALLERVPRLRDHIAFPRSGPSGKMLLARLYNAKVRVQSLVECFGVAHTTLRRWGLALLSGDMDRIKRAFSGQGAGRKITPEIESYVRDRFHELYGLYRNYSQQIREEVQKYFKVEVSAERLRWIFTEERRRLREAQGEVIPETVETEAEEGHDNLECNDKNTEPKIDERANSCETEVNTCSLERPILSQENNYLQHNDLLMQDSCKHNENDSLSITPNYSLWKGEMIYSGRSAPKRSKLVHHAGLVLFTPWLDQVTGDLTKHRDIITEIFSRWLQENDFSYLISHFGIDELTSRAHESYSSIEAELTDRQVRSLRV